MRQAAGESVSSSGEGGWGGGGGGGGRRASPPSITGSGHSVQFTIFSCACCHGNQGRAQCEAGTG